MTLGAVDSFRIDVPSSWQSIPVDRQALREVISGLQQAHPQLGPVERRRVELYLQRLMADLESVEARYVALCNVAPEVDEDQDAESADMPPLIAAVIVSLVDQQTIGSSIPLTPAAVLAAMSLTPDATGGAGVRTSELAPAAIVDLPHARAVRVRRMVEQKLTARDSLSIVTESYFVPAPDDYSRMLVVQFSTPNLADATAFSEVFEAIAETIRFYREGEETTL